MMCINNSYQNTDQLLLSDIPNGAEIYVNYGIKMADAPSWYKSLWVQHLRSKGMNNDEIINWCERQYSMNGRLIDLQLH